jgi:hypothetical protein
VDHLRGSRQIGGGVTAEIDNGLNIIHIGLSRLLAIPEHPRNPDEFCLLADCEQEFPGIGDDWEALRDQRFLQFPPLSFEESPAPPPSRKAFFFRGAIHRKKFGGWA